jgi:hypothetical protein
LNKKDIVKCILCGKIVHAGVRRLKQHLLVVMVMLLNALRQHQQSAKRCMGILRRMLDRSLLILMMIKRGEKMMKFK